MLNVYQISSEKKTNFSVLFLASIQPGIWNLFANQSHCFAWHFWYRIFLWNWGDLFCHIMQITANEHSLFNCIFSSYSMTTSWHLAWLCGLIPIRKLAFYFPTLGGMIKRPLSTVFWGWLCPPPPLFFTLVQELWHILGKIFYVGWGGRIMQMNETTCLDMAQKWMRSDSAWLA
jgi:hypothetical protein